jgi:hypothetical protein
VRGNVAASVSMHVAKSAQHMKNCRFMQTSGVKLSLLSLLMACFKIWVNRILTAGHERLKRTSPLFSTHVTLVHRGCFVTCVQGIHVPDVWEQLLEDCHKHLRLPAAQQAEARQVAHHILAKQHNPPWRPGTICRLCSGQCTGSVPSS